MGLGPEFSKALEHIEEMDFYQGPDDIAPFFETVIRYLGGLLGAYALVIDDGKTSSLKWKPELGEFRKSSHRSLKCYSNASIQKGA